MGRSRYEARMRHLACVVLAFACSKSSAEDAAPKRIALPALGLQIEVAGKASTAASHSGGMYVRVKAIQSEIWVDVREAPKTVDEVKALAVQAHKAELFATEQLADGFALTYQHTQKGATRYSVDVHRTIGGRVVTCSSHTDSDKQRAIALSACKSLAPT